MADDFCSGMRCFYSRACTAANDGVSSQRSLFSLASSVYSSGVLLLRLYRFGSNQALAQPGNWIGVTCISVVGTMLLLSVRDILVEEALWTTPAWIASLYIAFAGVLFIQAMHAVTTMLAVDVPMPGSVPMPIHSPLPVSAPRRRKRKRR
jgi:hypothetical protein